MDYNQASEIQGQLQRELSLLSMASSTIYNGSVGASIVSAWRREGQCATHSAYQTKEQHYIEHVVLLYIRLYNALRTHYLFEHEQPLALEDIAEFTLTALRLLLSTIREQSCLECGIEPHATSPIEFSFLPVLSSTIVKYSDPVLRSRVLYGDIIQQHSTIISILINLHREIKPS